MGLFRLIRMSFFITTVSSHLEESTESSNPVEPKLILEILKANSMENLNCFACSDEDSFNLMYEMNLNKIQAHSSTNGTTLGTLIDQNYTVAAFMDLSCSANELILLNVMTASNDNLFSSNILWILWSSVPLETDFLGNLNLEMYSNVWLIDPDMSITKIYKPYGGNVVLRELTATWRNESSTLVFESSSSTRSLGGRTLKGAMFFVQDVYDREKLKDQLSDRTYKPKMDTLNRYFYTLNLQIADLHKYKIKIIVTNNWGSKFPNGSWVGMLGLIQNKKVDFAITPLFILQERGEIASHTIAFAKYWLTFLFKQPRALGTYRATILEFSPSLWLCLGSVIVFAALFYYFIQKLFCSEQDSPRMSLFGCFLQLLGVFTNQGLVYNPLRIPLRITCFTMLVSALLVVNYYNAATLTSLLTPSAPLIQSLDDLLGSSIRVNLLDAAYFQKKEARHRAMDTKVWQKIDSERLELISMKEGMNRILKGESFLGEFSTMFHGAAEFLRDSVICELTAIPASAPALVVMYTSRDPNVQEMFRRGILRVWEHGMKHREFNMWIAQRPKCLESPQFIDIRLEAVSVALAIYLGGSFLSVVIFIGEIINYKLTFKM